MQDAYFVADGLVTSVDTVAKRIKLDVKRVLFHDKDYETDAAKNIELDVSIASISRDTGTVALRVVKEGMHITAASYAESLKDLKANDDDSMYAVLAIVPAPVPIDQIKIIDPESKQHQKEKENAQQEQPTDWIKVLWLSLAVIAGAVLLILLTPWFIWQYFNATARNAKDTKSKAFNSHRAVMYYMNQLGYNRANTGPYEYATSIDKKFDTRFASFSNVYQKLKYSSLPLTTKETENVQTFYSPFIQSIRKQVPFKIRLSKFMNIYNTIAYFTQSKNK
jgi:hypothetical protein